MKMTFPGIFLVSGSYFLALVLAIITIPPIIRVAKAKKLFDELNERKIHTRKVPVFGGIAIFIAFTLSTIISTNGFNIDSLKYILAAIIILFFTGLKDDILVISANTKFIIQLLAALMLIVMGNIRITDFQWVFRVREIGYPLSVAVSLLLIMATVNAYNFIDGIDGLASGLGIFASVIFGSWFYLAGDIPWSIMSFALAGSLSGFFVFNVFGKTNKLFMGDSGSLIIGLITSVLVIRFVEMNHDLSSFPAVYASPAVAFAIMFIPLFDLVRVFVIRISQKRSPFFADNRHIHHQMLRLVRSHLTITLIFLTVNLLIVLLSLYLSHIRLQVNIHLLILLAIGILFAITPTLLVSLRKKKAESKR